MANSTKKGEGWYIVGVLVMAQGFLSALLHSVWNHEFGWLSWASEYQPLAGIAFGLLGVALFGIGIVRSRA